MSLTTPPSAALAALRSLGNELDEVTSQHLFAPDFGSDSYPAKISTISGSPVTATDLPRKRRPRMAIAASLTILVLGVSIGTLTLRQRQPRYANEIPRNPARPGGPFAIPTYIPKGMCLTNNITFSGARTQDVSLNLLSKSGGRIAVIDTEYNSSEEVGTAVDVRGNPGFLSADGHLLVWKDQKHFISMISVSNATEQLPRIAAGISRSSGGKLTYTGADFSVDNPSSDRGEYFEQLVFQNCPNDKPEPSPFATSMLVRVDAGGDHVDGYRLPDGKAVTIPRPGEDSASVFKERVSGRDHYLWIEGKSLIDVTTRRGQIQDIEAFISGLKAAEEAAVGMLTVRSYSGPPLPADTVNWVPVSFEFNGIDIRFEWEARGTAAELSTKRDGYRSEPMSNDASETPYLRRCFDYSPQSDPAISCAYATANLVRAVATMPDGSKLDLPLIQDSRSRELNLFIWARMDIQPKPVRVDYFDATGKVVHTQR
jgi:hypothetical protein